MKERWKGLNIMSFISVMNEVFYSNLKSNAAAVSVQIGQELSRYCAGRHENGAAVSLKARKTTVPNVYVAAESRDDKACLVVDTDDHGMIVELTVYRGGPALVSSMISKTVGEIEAACGSEGRSFDYAKDAVPYWQRLR